MRLDYTYYNEINQASGTKRPADSFTQIKKNSSHVNTNPNKIYTVISCISHIPLLNVAFNSSQKN